MDEHAEAGFGPPSHALLFLLLRFPGQLRRGAQGHKEKTHCGQRELEEIPSLHMLPPRLMFIASLEIDSSYIATPVSVFASSVSDIVLAEP
jgi:hypothetical protein